MRAAPAARPASAVGRLGNSKITDGIIHHHCSGTKFLGDRFPPFPISGPHTGGQRKR